MGALNYELEKALSLPESSFAAVELFKANRATIAWAMPGYRVDLLLENAYCAPVEGENGVQLDMGDRVVAKVERYGGHGLGTNGGGVRCGIVGEVQIKGTARSCLAGRSAPFWHSFGGARLDECIQEVAWTSVLSQLLPIGAVKTYGIGLTGSIVPRPTAASSGRLTEQRALLFREPCLRLGHFLPSPGYAWRGADSGKDLVSEADRTRLAIRALPMILAKCLHGQGVTRGDADAGFEENMGTVIDRLAHQLATAMALRIAHGGLAASNMALDGRWLDFGATTAVSDFGPVITSGAAPTFLDQPQFVAQQLVGLNEAIEKFMPVAGVRVGSLADVFTRSFTARLGHEMMHLTGMDKRMLDRVEAEAKNRLAGLMSRVMLDDRREPSKLISAIPGHVREMPRALGRHGLGGAMVACSRAVGTGADESLTDWISNQKLGSELFESYRAVAMRALAGVEGDARDRVAECVYANAVRVTACSFELYRPNLHRAIESAIESREDIGVFVSRMTRKPLGIMRRSALDWQPLDAVLGAGSFCSAEHGVVVGGRRLGVEEVQKAARAAEPASRYPCAPGLAGRVRSHWRVDGAKPEAMGPDALIGACVSLLAARQSTARLTVAYLHGVLKAAIACGCVQFFFDEGGNLSGYAVWCSVGPETERRFLQTKMVAPQTSEWNEGTSTWMVDLVALPGRLKYVLRKLSSESLAKEGSVRYVRRKGNKVLVKEMERKGHLLLFRKESE